MCFSSKVKLYLPHDPYHHSDKQCPRLENDFSHLKSIGLVKAVRRGVKRGWKGGQRVRVKWGGSCNVMNKWAYKHALTHTRGRVFVQLICHFRSSKVMKIFPLLLAMAANLQIPVKCPQKPPSTKPPFSPHGIGQVPLFQDSGC